MIRKLRIRGYKIFDDFTLEPNEDINIIVGNNGAGKSTLLEAITLCLNGRYQGSSISDALNPYWFNRDSVNRFTQHRKMNPEYQEYPEIQIDVFLETDSRNLARLRGVNNMDTEDAIGISLWIHPNPEYATEMDDYFHQSVASESIPTDYYRVDWRSFAGETLSQKPKDIGIAMIDSNSLKSNRYLDYYTRQILDNYMDCHERRMLSAEYRKQRTEFATASLKAINDQIHANKSFDNMNVGVQVDPASNNTWEADLTPAVNDIPINFAGQGAQVIAKTVLAMGQTQENTSYVLIEEPENHLSHMKLRELLNLIQDSAQGRQLFITTHSSYVLNRLGLNQLVLLSNGKASFFRNLSPETISYFKQISGYNTLRVLLADKAVLVEGPSDEIVFNRFFKDKCHKEPADCGIDVMALNGTSFRRNLELAKITNSQAIALRDNDGKDPSHWINHLNDYLSDCRRMFIGEPADGITLEPQIVNANPGKLQNLLGKGNASDDEVSNWMEHHKTESALIIAQSDQTLIPPPYIARAIDAIMG